MFKLGTKNKQYGTNFEVATSSQIELQLQNFLHAFFFWFLHFKTIQVHGSLDN
jgi:hypothetical protein